MLATVARLLARAVVVPQMQCRSAWPHWMVLPPLQAMHTLLLSYRHTRNLAKLNVITVLHVRQIPGQTKCCCCPTGIIHLAKLNVITVLHVRQIPGQIEAIAVLHTPGQTEHYCCWTGATHTWPNWMLLLSHKYNTHLAKMCVTVVLWSYRCIRHRARL